MESIKLKIDSHPVPSQIKGGALTKEPTLQCYVRLVREKLTKFKMFEIEHVPREENTILDILSKMANTGSSCIDHSFIQETLKTIMNGGPNDGDDGSKQ